MSEGNKKAIANAKSATVFEIEPERITVVGLLRNKDEGIEGVDTDDGPEHVDYDPRIKLPLWDEDRMASIARHGIMQRCLLKRGGPAPDGLIAKVGIQRIRNARRHNKRMREAGRPGDCVLVPVEAPSFLERGRSSAEVEGIGIITNEAWTRTPLAMRAELAGKHLRTYKGDEREAAVDFGVDVKTYKKLLAFQEATDDLKQAHAAGRIGDRVAMDLAMLPKDQQANAVEETVAAGGTVADAVDVVKKARGKSASTKPSPRLAKKLLALRNDEEQTVLAGVWEDESFWDGVRWMLGEKGSDRFKNLTAMIKRVTGEK